MNKLINFKREDRSNIEREIETNATMLGLGDYDPISSNEGLLKDQIGICYNCLNLNYCRSEFGTVLAYCNTFEIKLSGQNRIIECNCHSPRGCMSLQDMFSIAVLIDIDKKEVGLIRKI